MAAIFIFSGVGISFRVLTILSILCLNYQSLVLGATEATVTQKAIKELTKLSTPTTTSAKPNQWTTLATTTSTEACSCCSFCGVTPTKVFENGKNRERSLCDKVLTPDNRPFNKSYDWTKNPLLIVVETYPPYINATGYEFDVEIEGPMADLLAYLAQTIKFRYCLFRRSDGQWGQRQSNLSYSGVYGMMENNEVDLVLGPIFPTVDRLKIMDFSTSVHFETLSALFGKPTVKRNIYNYIMAFSWQVWLVIMFTLCIVGATAFFLYTCGPDKSKNKPFTLYFAGRQFWLFFGVMVSQGMGNPPTYCPVRVLNSFWWLVAIILAAYYNSKLIALMVTVKSYNSFDDLLLPNTDTTIIISQTTLADVKDSKSIYYILRQKSGNGTVGDALTDPNMDLVSFDNYAIVAFRTEIQTAVSTRFTKYKECEFNTGTDTYTFTKEMSIGYNKNLNATLQQKINEALNDMFEKGIFRAMLKHVLNSQVDCFVSASAGGGAMTMEDVKGMFLLWLYGMTAALFVLILESLVYCCKVDRTVSKVARRRKEIVQDMPKRDFGNDYVERHKSRRRVTRGYADKPFYMAYNSSSYPENTNFGY